ncbi:MAG: hypothetical protein K2Y28_13650, partial [Burkholderiaceae bacterium]|nr:hypothetical protein [Burkholderiaceae bacterium]
MFIQTPNEAENLRAEIAMLAARMIAEDGADYGAAKRRAAKQILGNTKVRGDVLPDNEQIEHEVREYNALFFADTQPQKLLELRELALRIMQQLAEFNPYIVGAVLNGTANMHSDIHLHLFTDNGKDVALFLLNKNIQFEVTESSNARSEGLETFSFMAEQVGVHLVVHDADAIRQGG